jgi:hypothetical protein
MERAENIINYSEAEIIGRHLFQNFILAFAEKGQGKPR